MNHYAVATALWLVLLANTACTELNPEYCKVHAEDEICATQRVHETVFTLPALPHAQSDYFISVKDGNSPWRPLAASDIDASSSLTVHTVNTEFALAVGCLYTVTQQDTPAHGYLFFVTAGEALDLESTVACISRYDLQETPTIGKITGLSAAQQVYARYDRQPEIFIAPDAHGEATVSFVPTPNGALFLRDSDNAAFVPDFYASANPSFSWLQRRPLVKHDQTVDFASVKSASIGIRPQTTLSELGPVFTASFSQSEPTQAILHFPAGVLTNAKQEQTLVRNYIDGVTEWHIEESDSPGHLREWPHHLPGHRFRKVDRDRYEIDWARNAATSSSEVSLESSERDVLNILATSGYLTATGSHTAIQTPNHAIFEKVVLRTATQNVTVIDNIWNGKRRGLGRTLRKLKLSVKQTE